ncbi:MAG: def1 [Firmicutes bacterium]|nr:def1 [Bacillota bacterium]
MPVMEIRKAGDRVLKEIAAPVEKIDRKIKHLLDNMAETMYSADGVGLAAPQVGVSLRLVVIDVGEGIIELINPEIIACEGSEEGTEGCLSVPGMYGEVERYATVTVEALNRAGKTIRINGSGLLARAFQHEIDHLKGILFIELAKTIHKG